METIYLIIISMLATSTIYFALKAHKYKTFCSAMKWCFKKRYNFEISTDELREAVREELRERFNK